MSTDMEATKEETTQVTAAEETPTAKSEKAPVVKADEGTATKASNGDTKKPTTDNPPDKTDGGHSLHVKTEYILTERAKSLGPVVTDYEMVELEPGASREGGKKERRQKKKRGQNKKRPRDEKPDDCMKMCISVIQGLPCGRGEHCRYSHDIKAYMNLRPADIREIEGGCPNYAQYGFCVYGLTCRLGSCHISKTGENLTKEGVTRDTQSFAHPDGVMNVLQKDVQVQLRKKKYAFKCKRHFEKAEQKTEQPKLSETTSEAAEDLVQQPATMPLPSKTRKLVDFSNKVYVAPLTTVGNLPFRRIMKKFGADITCGEMALATNLLEGKNSEWALLKRHPEEDVFGVQIAAGHEDQYIRCCELLEATATVDWVDLNLGCPLELVCNKGAGAALMLREKKLRGILQGVSATLSCPFTVKIRTGWDMTKPIAHKLVPKVQSWNIEGLNAMMIHGRSRLQRYQLLANWNYISEVATSLSDDFPKFPVIGNGDIFSYTDYEEKKAHDGVASTAMLGRGALVKPWLPTEIKERRHWDISASERLDILKQFVKFGLENWGSDQQGVNSTRRFLLEWLSFLYRYVPVGLLDVLPQQMNQRPPRYMQGRSDLETLFLSPQCADWVKISEMLLGPVPDGFKFRAKHKANGYVNK